MYEKVIEPGFEKRNWSLDKISKARASKACKQADCLSWDVFTIAQKKELKLAIFKLSSNFKVKVCVFLFSNHLNFIINTKNRILNFIKYNTKILVFKLSKKHSF